MSQPLVRRNDWRSLTPPALGPSGSAEWTPTLSVSVVVPTYRAEATLPYVLAALAAQSYPAHLLEVVVVDDNEEPGVVLPEVRPDNTRVVRVTEGWGRANACHTGAVASDGDVLHWLDSDMLAYREHVEAQLRWHHLIDYAVVLGTKRFVDPAPVLQRSPAEVRDIVAAGAAETLFARRDSEPHKWVEGMWKRSDDLTTAGPRAFRAHVGATGSLTRSLYDAAGGMDTSLRLGEDMELGHRLAEAGGVLIPEHAAKSWHLGHSHVMQQREEVNRYNDAFLANLVPGMRPKRNRRGRIYDVPYLEVVIVMDGPADQVIACVDSVLDSTLDDLRVVLVGSWSSLGDERRSPLADPLLDLRIVERTYRSDPRVELVPALPAGRCRAAFRLTLDVAWAPLPDALQALLDDLERTHEGLRLVSNGSADDGVARLERTAAVSRALRVGASSPAEVDAVIGRAFGCQVLTAAEAGFVSWAEREVPRHEGKLKPPVDPAESRALSRGRVGEAAVPHERRGLFGFKR